MVMDEKTFKFRNKLEEYIQFTSAVPSQGEHTVFTL